MFARRVIASSPSFVRGIADVGKPQVWRSKDKTYNFLTQKAVSMIGAPLAAGQHQLGVEKGPQALRDAGLESVIRELGWDYHDVGDLAVEAEMAKFTGNTTCPRVNNCEQIGLANKLIHDTVKQEASKGNFVLTVGGDHSIGSATVSGMRAVHEDLVVIWVDAHADCNTPMTSPSGNYHGMPVAHVAGWIKPDLPNWEWLNESCRMKEQRIALLGLRDVDAMERQLLRGSGTFVYTMHEVDRYGIGQVLDMAIHNVNPYSDRPVHISFDIDSCDPSIAPGTGTCSRGGLTFREAHYIMERLSMTNNVVSCDLVEVNPNLDVQVTDKMHGDDPHIQTDQLTVRLGVELIASVLGKTIA